MKILLVNKFHYLKGGSERVYLATKKLLEDYGHEVVCFSMKHEKNLPCAQEKFFVKKVDFSSKKKFFSKFFRFFYYCRAAKNLQCLIEQEKPDLAHLHNISHQLTPSILKPLKKNNIPVVQTLHDYQAICPNYRLYTQGHVCEKCKKHKYHNCLINKCLQDSYLASALAALELTLQWLFKFYRQKVDLFISPSVFLKQKLKEWGVKRPINVLPNFLELDRFQPNYDSQDCIVCVSRLSQEKGVFTLLQAMKELPDKKLKLIGSGPLQKKVRLFIEENKIDNVDYLGAKYGEELFNIMAKAKFIVVPSEWYENYPMVVLEAMALGKPVLASGIGGLNDMVEENKNGWFFKSADKVDLMKKISQNYHNPELSKMGKMARQTVELKNSSTIHYQELIKIYGKVLPEKIKLTLG